MLPANSQTLTRAWQGCLRRLVWRVLPPVSLSEMDERQKQAQRLRESLDRKAEEARARAEEHSLEARERPVDEADVRAKSSGHKKKTADKWNQ
jgi:hypothetical protein